MPSRRRRQRIETEDDVLDVISIIRLTYDRVVESHGLPSKDSE